MQKVLTIKMQLIDTMKNIYLSKDTIKNKYASHKLEKIIAAK